MGPKGIHTSGGENAERYEEQNVMELPPRSNLQLDGYKSTDGPEKKISAQGVQAPRCDWGKANDG